MNSYRAKPSEEKHFRQHFFSIVGVGALILYTASIRPAAAQDDAWLTSDALERTLASSTSIHWSQRPLRTGLQNLSGSYAPDRRLAIMLDRRVDPGQLVDAHIEDTPLLGALQQLAASLELAAVRVGATIYIGPPEVAGKLRTLAALRLEDVRGLPRPVRSPVAQESAVEWGELATPREIIEKSAVKHGFQVDGLERIPHDLWAAGGLAPAMLFEQWTLLAAQFDQTFRFSDDGKSIELIPIEAPVVIARRYPAGREVEQRLAQLKDASPDLKVEMRGGELIVSATVEQHEAIAALLRGESRPAAGRSTPDNGPQGESRYALTVQNETVGRILGELETRLGLTFHWEIPTEQTRQAAQEKMVSFEVHQATLEELLTAILEPAGLNFTATGNEISLQPK